MLHIFKRLPMKLRKVAGRWGRAVAWCAGLYASCHHIMVATEAALRTKVDVVKLSIVRRFGVCVRDATADIGTILDDGSSTFLIGLKAFFEYFEQNLVIAGIVAFTLYETIRNLAKGIRWFRRWRTIHRAKITNK